MWKTNGFVLTTYMMSGWAMNTNDESFAISYLEKISCYAGFFFVVQYSKRFAKFSRMF